MLAPSNFHFTNLDQMLLSAGTTARLLAACFLGGIVGIEREWRHKASGLRTNMLVCLGCAFFTVLSANLAGEGNPNKGQVASNIVQGIGFLGAGLILHTRSRVLGLNSAATVFVVASIGMACGAGLYVEAALATFIAVMALHSIGWMEGRLSWKQYVLLYEVRGTDPGQMYPRILHVMDQRGMRLNVVERDAFATMERITFQVNTNRERHAALLAELRANAPMDQVMCFSDSEQD